MRHRHLGFTLCLLATAAAAQSYRAPRTPDGKPDLQGFWQALNTASFNIEPHSPALGIPGGLGIVADPPDGKIPYKPEAAAQQQQNFRNRAARDPLHKCYSPGVPRMMYLPFPFQIIQTPKFIAITSEYAHTVRNVSLDSKHISDLDFYMGDSRGHWEGETLVVDVTSNNDETWFDAAGNFHSDALHVVERYTRTEPDVLTYEATIEDPKVLTKPFKIAMPLYRHREKNFRLLEYECQAYAEEDQK
ncbi:MAG TPA: hypothetical protein VLY24_19075 [Bryobacteraceae bacterium]|nr:hypothetical protein [Bryobacteraceae bacterium]